MASCEIPATNETSLYLKGKIPLVLSRRKSLSIGDTVNWWVGKCNMLIILEKDEAVIGTSDNGYSYHEDGRIPYNQIGADPRTRGRISFNPPGKSLGASLTKCVQSLLNF